MKVSAFKEIVIHSGENSNKVGDTLRLLRRGVGEILEKEMSLVGVQRPTPAWMMRSGTEFFRFGDFRGYVIEGQGG